MRVEGDAALKFSEKVKAQSCEGPEDLTNPEMQSEQELPFSYCMLLN